MPADPSPPTDRRRDAPFDSAGRLLGATLPRLAPPLRAAAGLTRVILLVAVVAGAAWAAGLWFLLGGAGGDGATVGAGVAVLTAAGVAVLWWLRADLLSVADTAARAPEVVRSLPAVAERRAESARAQVDDVYAARRRPLRLAATLWRARSLFRDLGALGVPLGSVAGLLVPARWALVAVVIVVTALAVVLSPLLLLAVAVRVAG